MIKYKQFIYVIIMLLLMVPISSFACDFCLLSQGISPLDTMKGPGIKISERYTLLDKVYQGTSEQSNPGAKETHLLSLVMPAG
jgi:hypothetical protein